MNSYVSNPAFWSRLQFGFTITYHYLFPQLTMGLAWFLVYWKWRALKTGDEEYNKAVRFWAKIFGLNFPSDISPSRVAKMNDAGWLLPGMVKAPLAEEAFHTMPLSLSV